MKAPIQELVASLSEHFAVDERGRGAAQLLARYAREHDDWRGYARFDPAFYTRNLVARNAAFEMLVLCWGAAHASPIHDHAGEHCFMSVLQGEIEESQYAFPAEGAPTQLVRLDAKVFAAGEVAYIHDRIALHRVRPCGGAPAVSLHLYARPIDVCRVFDEATGQVLERQLTYHSVGA